MKLSPEKIKELEEAKYVVVFEREPQIDDSFTIGEVTFVAKKKEFKIVVL